MTTVVACPACRQDLQVPPGLLGQQVRCPGCAHVFAAGSTMVPAAVPPPLPTSPDEDVPVRDVVVEDVPVWEKRPEGDLARPLDEDEAKRLQADADEAERRRREKEEKKARKKEPEESAYYDQLTRQQRERQRKMESPHRAPAVLTLGILSIVFSPLCLLAIGAAVCGYYAYQMGSHDLQEMLSGRMDRSGEPFVKTGRILGIIGICLSIPVILITFGIVLLTLARFMLGVTAGR